MRCAIYGSYHWCIVVLIISCRKIVTFEKRNSRTNTTISIDTSLAINEEFREVMLTEDVLRVLSANDSSLRMRGK